MKRETIWNILWKTSSANYFGASKTSQMYIDFEKAVDAAMEELEKDKSTLSVNGKIVQEGTQEYDEIRGLSQTQMELAEHQVLSVDKFEILFDKNGKVISRKMLERKVNRHLVLGYLPGHSGPHKYPDRINNEQLDYMIAVDLFRKEDAEDVKSNVIIHQSPELNRVKEVPERLKQTNEEREKLLEKALQWFKKESPFKFKLGK